MIKERFKNSQNKCSSEKINVLFNYKGILYPIQSDKDELFGSIFKRFQDTIGDYTKKFDYYDNGFLEPQMKLNEKNITNCPIYRVDV